jgi:hypothetical protein
MGPLLHFRGCAGGAWRLSATLTSDHEPPPLLTGDGGRAAPARLTDEPGEAVWRYDFALAMGPDPREATYAIGERSWRVAVPAIGGELRVAFTACNGDETEEGAWTTGRNERWTHLHRRNERAPFHLLIQGGDQIYADGMWRRIPALARWKRLSRRWQAETPYGESLDRAVRADYRKIYTTVFGYAEVDAVTARVPSIMMWDDHEILDGWGSHPPERQESPVYRGVFAAAREAFALFQLGARPDALPDGFLRRDGRHFGSAWRIGDVGLIVPDLRSVRTQRRIMDDVAWADFRAGLDRLEGCRQLLIVSTVPTLNVDLSAIERVLMATPGYQSYQDDLRDQWQSRTHRKEWMRFLDALLDFGERNDATVLSLSGEIHIGCYGRARRGRAMLHQMTSSGIVHPPSPGPLVAFLNWWARKTKRLPNGAEMEIPPFFNGSRYLARRNWLELTLPPGGGTQAVWHAEGGGHHPLEIDAPAAR